MNQQVISGEQAKELGASQKVPAFQIESAMLYTGYEVALGNVTTSVHRNPPQSQSAHKCHILLHPAGIVCDFGTDYGSLIPYSNIIGIKIKFVDRESKK